MNMIQKVSGAQMYQAMVRAMTTPHGLYLTLYSVDQYDAMTCYLSHDGAVGGALKTHDDGWVEAVSLFNNGGPKGSGLAMLDHLVREGANYLECFDGVLPRIYATRGFAVADRFKFDDQYAPAGWAYGAFGRPDLVTMTLANAATKEG